MPPKKNKTNVIVWWVLGGVCVCCVLPIVGLGGAGFWLFGKAKGVAGCSFAFTDVQKGILRYAEAHGNKMPKAETWQDDVREDYRKSMTPKAQLGPIEQMPADGDWGCKDSEGVQTGMAFNSDLSGKKLADIQDQVSTVLIFETAHAAKNQHESYKPSDFTLSPKMLGKNRGWMEAPVSGVPYLLGQYGVKTPINTGASAKGGVNINMGPQNTSGN